MLLQAAAGGVRIASASQSAASGQHSNPQRQRSSTPPADAVKAEPETLAGSQVHNCLQITDTPVQASSLQDAPATQVLCTSVSLPQSHVCRCLQARTPRATLEPAGSRPKGGDELPTPLGLMAAVLKGVATRILVQVPATCRSSCYVVHSARLCWHDSVAAVLQSRVCTLTR